LRKRFKTDHFSSLQEGQNNKKRKPTRDRAKRKKFPPGRRKLGKLDTHLWEPNARKSVGVRWWVGLGTRKQNCHTGDFLHPKPGGSKKGGSEGRGGSGGVTMLGLQTGGKEMHYHFFWGAGTDRHPYEDSKGGKAVEKGKVWGHPFKLQCRKGLSNEYQGVLLRGFKKIDGPTPKRKEWSEQRGRSRSMGVQDWVPALGEKGRGGNQNPKNIGEKTCVDLGRGDRGVWGVGSVFPIRVQRSRECSGGGPGGGECCEKRMGKGGGDSVKRNRGHGNFQYWGGKPTVHAWVRANEEKRKSLSNKLWKSHETEGHQLVEHHRVDCPKKRKHGGGKGPETVTGLNDHNAHGGVCSVGPTETVTGKGTIPPKVGGKPAW